MRVVGLADSDSYVKWGAALLGALPGDWERELLVVDSPIVVSDAQLVAATAGSGVERVSRTGLTGLVERIAAKRPDAVLLAMRGPAVMTIARDLARLSPRPVIVSGLPGISIPATRKALVYRRQADLFVLHSKREIREFGAMSSARGWDHRFGLATLPFAARRPASGTDLVFAAQAIVPAERGDRLRMAAMLRSAALADPTRRVVVKVRALPGEMQTHPERDAYPDLLPLLGDPPPNLVVSAAPMAEALDTAEGLVTVSSTAAIEAIARGIPVQAVDTFGIAPRLINPVFEGSGLFGGTDAVVARDVRHPRAEWLHDNYFHDPADDDWIGRLCSMVVARRLGTLPARDGWMPVGGRLREAWDRKRAFGAADRSLAGAAALVVGVPARMAARTVRGLRGAARSATRQETA